MSSNHTICYFSRASSSITDEEIQNIFKHTDIQNNKLGISGILLYSFGNFFQVLEGDKLSVIDLYENKIKEDKRHDSLFEIFNKEINHNIFSSYNSKFQTIKCNKQLEDIKKYLATYSIRSEVSEKLSRLLKSFLI